MPSANIKITLPQPIELEDKKVSELEFREPTGADMESFLGEIISMNEGGSMLGRAVTGMAAATVISHPLSEDDFRAMSGKNYMAVAMEMVGFLE